MTTKSYVTKVISAGENGEIALLFPPKLLEDLDLKENEVLKWDVDTTSGTVTITKTDFIYQSSKEENKE